MEEAHSAECRLFLAAWSMDMIGTVERSHTNHPLHNRPAPKVDAVALHLYLKPIPYSDGPSIVPGESPCSKRPAFPFHPSLPSHWPFSSILPVHVHACITHMIHVANPSNNEKGNKSQSTLLPATTPVMPMATTLHHAAVSKYCHSQPVSASAFPSLFTQASLVNSGRAV